MIEVKHKFNFIQRLLINMICCPIIIINNDAYDYVMKIVTLMLKNNKQKISTKFLFSFRNDPKDEVSWKKHKKSN